MLEPSPSAVATKEMAGGTGGPPDALAEAVEFEVSRTKRYGVSGWLAMGWLAFVLVCAILIPMFMHAPVNTGKYANKGFLDELKFPLGTDGNGNNMVLLLAKGARNSLIVSVGAILFGLVVGGSLGLVAGYFRGRLDSILTGIFNILLAIPQLVLAIALVSVLATDTIDNKGIPHPVSSGRRLLILVIALGIVSVPILARITRANALQWSQREFVLAARAQGARNLTVMVREVLPNVLPAMFSIALLGIAVAMVAEGGLSILGVGVHFPSVSWGNMIAIGRADLRASPHIVFEPIACIFLTVLSLNYLGDVIRARFDVRESVL
ncbi:MAG: ABC-type dipeptide/oligopeptide/nickel transport system, permease component [Actinomycetia bacterium]|nr:ABC-type dipeptide/oligopeptide/nickel transport system, permease component [Actinomycetes bacterium]